MVLSEALVEADPKVQARAEFEVGSIGELEIFDPGSRQGGNDVLRFSAAGPFPVSIREITLAVEFEGGSKRGASRALFVLPGDADRGRIMLQIRETQRIRRAAQ